jgi:hypothetical protein
MAERSVGMESESKRPDEGASRFAKVPDLSESLAAKSLVQGVGRHGVSHFGQRWIIDFFVAAQVVALAQAACEDTSQIACHQLHTPVRAAHLHCDGRGV